MEALLDQLQRVQRPIDLVQTLHQNQIKAVPARYIIPSNQRSNDALANCNTTQRCFPVIDLAGSDDFHHRSKIVEQLAQACDEWGFFQIINHGIPLALLEKVKEVSQEFFDLPLEEKRKQCPVRAGHTMLEGYGRFLDISDDTILDWVDALVHFISPPSIKAVQHWPTKPITYRETYEKYGEEILKLTNKLMGMLSEGLGLPPDYIQNLHKEPTLQLRINYYPPCPQPELVNGLRPHSDGGSLTVLLADDRVEGLQVRTHDGWFSVPPLPGSLTVNAGDMLQIISNGKYKSAEHRAVVNGQQHRMSIAMFLTPSGDQKIWCAAQLVDETHPPLYKPTTSKEYVTKYMSQEIRGKTMLNSTVTSNPDQLQVQVQVQVNP